ncbi:hypothetical protein DFH08DRAFT_951197 [Mycena albidolilacea]|uniref:Uncharacterized protein n=1 Tax=Mycena albidolilacea TaxID=1033008 RepID=A0AAD7F1I0_9AGAR|nr:hypothetical protein DFH08DRAFT_951197 [Mycena albidolilacea]
MPLGAADRISEGLCTPLAPTCLGCVHRSSRSNDVVSRGTGWLGPDGDVIHPHRALNLRSTVLAPASLASFRRVHFAYAVSTAVLFREDVLRAGLGLGGPSETGNGNTCVAAQAIAECMRARTFGKSPPTFPYPLDCAIVSSGIGEHSTQTVHQRHPPYPWRPHQRTIRAPDDRHTRPPGLSPRYVISFSPVPPVPPSGSLALDPPSLTVSTVLSPPSVSPPYCLHPRVDFPACRVSTTRLGSNNPSPPIQRRFSRRTFSEPPRIGLRRPQATICRESGPNARKIRTLRITSWSRPQRPPCPAHSHYHVLIHAPRRAITIMRPKPAPRAGPDPFYELPVLRRLVPPHPRT